MINLERIKLLTQGLRNLYARNGWKKLILKGCKVIWGAVTTTGVKNAQGTLYGMVARNANALGYEDWIKLYEKLDATTLAKQREHAQALNRQPVFSILVATCNTPGQILVELIESVLAQTYPGWELCIVDFDSKTQHVQSILDRFKLNDQRIRVIYPANKDQISEATNSALEIANGEYICLMGQSDTIAHNALYEFALKLNDEPSLDFIYSDEDRISFDGLVRFDPNFKPDWSPEYLECNMYTSQFACYRTEIARRIGKDCKGFEGAQDYEFMLRFSEHMGKIAHVPKILYHVRTTTSTTVKEHAHAPDAAIRALKEHFSRTGGLEFVKPSHFPGCYHVRRQIDGNPKISIVIPSAGRNSLILGKEIDLLANCIASIMEKSTYSNFEIVVVDNSDLRSETLTALAKYPVKFIHYKEPVFNVAAKMNLGAKHASGDYLLFLNDDTEVISPDWIEAMLSLAQLRSIGAVGAKLFFEDGTLQHAGVTFFNGLPDHIRRGYPGEDPGYFFSSEGQRNYMAVTGACILLKEQLFQEVGGFDEEFAVNFNDIDLCLKIWQKGYRNVYTGQAKLYHFESRNRKREVAIDEQDLFLKRWAGMVGEDPYYSKYFRAAPPNFELKPY